MFDCYKGLVTFCISSDTLGPFQGGEKQLQSVCKVRDELPQSRQPSSQLLHSFSGGRRLRFHNGPEFNGIGFNPPLCHHEA